MDRGREQRGAPTWAPVAGLCVLIVIAIGFAVWQGTAWARHEAQPDPVERSHTVDVRNPSHEDGLFETVGSGRDVLVIMAAPLQACESHARIAAWLKELAAAHGDALTVHFCPPGSPLGVKATGTKCAGYSVNGSNSYTYTDESGAERTAVFAKAPGMESYSAKELKMAIVEALREAGEDVSDIEVESEAPSEGP